MSDLFIALNHVLLGFLQFLPPVLDQSFQLIHMVCQPLQLVSQASDVRVISLMLYFKVANLLLDSSDLSFLIMLLLFHFL